MKFHELGISRLNPEDTGAKVDLIGTDSNIFNWILMLHYGR
jgi:hypothetical protein